MCWAHIQDFRLVFAVATLWEDGIGLNHLDSFCKWFWKSIKGAGADDKKGIERQVHSLQELATSSTAHRVPMLPAWQAISRADNLTFYESGARTFLEVCLNTSTSFELCDIARTALAERREKQRMKRIRHCGKSAEQRKRKKQVLDSDSPLLDSEEDQTLDN